MCVHTQLLQLLNVKKFLQKIHSSSQAVVSGQDVGGAVGAESPARLLLAPDVFLECQEIVLQITDDPFEVKLKANYEVQMRIIIFVVMEILNWLELFEV